MGRFGWKGQHANLLSFAGDAYLNEMGITNKLFPDEVTLLCNTASEPNDTPGPDGLEDIDHFARFMRAMKAPPRDAALAQFGKAEAERVRLGVLEIEKAAGGEIHAALAGADEVVLASVLEVGADRSLATEQPQARARRRGAHQNFLWFVL